VADSESMINSSRLYFQEVRVGLYQVCGCIKCFLCLSWTWNCFLSTPDSREILLATIGLIRSQESRLLPYRPLVFRLMSLPVICSFYRLSLRVLSTTVYVPCHPVIESATMSTIRRCPGRNLAQLKWIDCHPYFENCRLATGD